MPEPVNRDENRPPQVADPITPQSLSSLMGVYYPENNPLSRIIIDQTEEADRLEEILRKGRGVMTPVQQSALSIRRVKILKSLEDSIARNEKIKQDQSLKIAGSMLLSLKDALEECTVATELREAIIHSVVHKMEMAQSRDKTPEEF